MATEVQIENIAITLAPEIKARFEKYCDEAGLSESEATVALRAFVTGFLWGINREKTQPV